MQAATGAGTSQIKPRPLTLTRQMGSHPGWLWAGDPRQSLPGFSTGLPRKQAEGRLRRWDSLGGSGMEGSAAKMARQPGIPRQEFD